MKLVAIVFVLLCVSCVHRFELESPKDRCTRAGQNYEGFTITGEADGREVGNVRCVVPKSTDDKCELSKEKRMLDEREQYNDRWLHVYAYTTVGYVFYIVPGYLVHKAYEDETTADLEKTNARIAEISNESCGESAH